MKYTIIVFILLLFACEGNVKLIDPESVSMTLNKPAISAYIDSDSSYIRVSVSRIIPFQQAHSLETAIIKNARIIFTNENGQETIVPFLDESYSAKINVKEMEKVSLKVEIGKESYYATTVLPRRPYGFSNDVKMDGKFELSWKNHAKDAYHQISRLRRTSSEEYIGFNISYPKEYVFHSTGHQVNVTGKLRGKQGKIPGKGSAFSFLIYSFDKNLYDFLIFNEGDILLSGVQYQSPYSNFDNGAIGYFGSLNKTELKIIF